MHHVEVFLQMLHALNPHAYAYCSVQFSEEIERNLAQNKIVLIERHQQTLCIEQFTFICTLK